MAAMDNLYGITFALLMDNSRANNFTPILLNGTVVKSIEPRIVQGRTSTRVLQGLLSAILLSVLITIFTLKIKKVLPQNPCSIAAVASLMFDSELLNILSEDKQQLSQKALFRVLDGYVFSLGWWGGVTNPRRRLGIDVGRAEKVC